MLANTMNKMDTIFKKETAVFFFKKHLQKNYTEKIYIRNSCSLHTLTLRSGQLQRMS